MKKLVFIILPLMSLLVAVSCSKDWSGEPIAVEQDIYSSQQIPEMHIEVALNDWNAILSAYDHNEYTMKVINCDATFVDERGEVTVKEAGLKLHGNYSRERPEGDYGEKHVAGDTDWHHFHFLLNLGYNFNDADHEIHGCDKLLFKWFHEDPTYVREIYSYDLFQRAGVWTGSKANYCKVYFHVEGDSDEAYYGIYAMIEPVDGSFIRARKGLLGNKDDGFLWKCRLGASLRNFTSGNACPDLNDSKRKLYTLKTGTDDYDKAFTQMKDFTDKLKTLSGEEYQTWMREHCDVPFLLKTYATNVVLGMWDDYWNNNNNYYIYFDSRDTVNYKVYLIPFDYDNSLGTCNSTGKVKDSGRTDPFKWGLTSNTWISKILENEEWHEVYRQELLRLVDQDNNLFYYDASQERISAWWKRIMPYVDNDTGEDTVVDDKPASWGTVGNYRLSGDSQTNNFFLVQTANIHKYCDEQ